MTFTQACRQLRIGVVTAALTLVALLAGCSGDAITRGKKGEDIGYITKTFGYWFCDRYKDYAGDGTEKMPFDQHWLIAASAPRHVAVGASSLDEWADPESENLCCAAASPPPRRSGAPPP